MSNGHHNGHYQGRCNGHHHGHHHDHHHDHDHDDHHHEHHGHHDGHSGCDHNHNSLWAYLPHAHGLSERIQADKRALKIACVVLTVSLCAQIGGGMLVDSSVLEAEAVHTALDGLVLAVSLLSIALASRERTARYTYGYGRAEVLSALISVLTLALMCVQLGGGAIRRLLAYHGLAEHKAIRKGQALFVAEGLTLINNVIIAFVLARNSSLNIRALRAHVVGDSIGNVLVLLAGATMWLRPDFAILDPILTLVVVIAICVLNVPLAKETFEVLMQAAPKSLGAKEVVNKAASVAGVKRVRDAHVWTLTSGAVVASVKLEVEPSVVRLIDYSRIQSDVERVLVNCGVNEVTVQVKSYVRSADSDDEGTVIERERHHRVMDDARYELVEDEEEV